MDVRILIFDVTCVTVNLNITAGFSCARFRLTSVEIESLYGTRIQNPIWYMNRLFKWNIHIGTKLHVELNVSIIRLGNNSRKWFFFDNFTNFLSFKISRQIKWASNFWSKKSSKESYFDHLDQKYIGTIWKSTKIAIWKVIKIFELISLRNFWSHVKLQFWCTFKLFQFIRLAQIRSKTLDQNAFSMHIQHVILNLFKHFSEPKFEPTAYSLVRSREFCPWELSLARAK